MFSLSNGLSVLGYMKSATSNLSVVLETISKTANHQTNQPILIVVPVILYCKYSALSITSDPNGVK